MTKCPVCREHFDAETYDVLAEHLLAAAGASDPAHIRFLNQSISRHRLGAPELAGRLAERFAIPPEGLATWIRRTFVRRFFSERPHPFVVALQRPTPAVLLGYAVEHQHFLRQWVRCCAFVLARSGEPDVVQYELENIGTEFVGQGAVPSHFELLLRMGESSGRTRAEITGMAPLPTTARTLAEWHAICAEEPWVAALAAMHSLELIAHRDLMPYGATLHYFDPAILDDEGLPAAARAFLREGYEADIGHADEALALVERYATTPEVVADVQGVVLRSIDLFDDYLGARLQRAEEYGPTA